MKEILNTKKAMYRGTFKVNSIGNKVLVEKLVLYFDNIEQMDNIQVYTEKLFFFQFL